MNLRYEKTHLIFMLFSHQLGHNKRLTTLQKIFNINDDAFQKFTPNEKHLGSVHTNHRTC